jgi:hypothetical protein
VKSGAPSADDEESQDHQHNVRDDEAGDVSNPTKRPAVRLRSPGYVKEHSSGVVELRNFRSPCRVQLSRAYISFARVGAHTTERKAKMTKMKMLSAAIILSAAVATPVFAQDAGVRDTGSRYGLAQQPSPRGAYNQLNGPSDATTRTRDRWNPANPSTIERDPSTPGGEDTALRPSSS